MAEKTRLDTLFCHFSFKRPRDEEGYGYFAVAMFKNAEGTRNSIVYRNTCKRKLWQDHQFITAIQSYENVLNVIYKNQGFMLKNGIENVMLVTDNSTLAGWIENHKKRKDYTEWLEKAVTPYRRGGVKEIRLSIGLMETFNYEKSYKFCKAEYVTEQEDDSKVVKESSTGRHLINIEASGIKLSTISQITEADSAVPNIEGIALAE